MISLRTLALALLAICGLALLMAVVAQYGFGLRPCELCLIQRVPFVVTALLAAFSLQDKTAPPVRRTLLWIAGLLLVLNGAIAVYHVGVEQHWWASAVCPASVEGAVTLDDLATAMNKPVEAHCDQPQWDFHGITMAAMNIPFSFGLGLLTLALLRRKDLQS